MQGRLREPPPTKTTLCPGAFPCRPQPIRSSLGVRGTRLWLGGEPGLRPAAGALCTLAVPPDPLMEVRDTAHLFTFGLPKNSGRKHLASYAVLWTHLSVSMEYVFYRKGNPRTVPSGNTGKRSHVCLPELAQGEGCYFCGTCSARLLAPMPQPPCAWGPPQRATCNRAVQEEAGGSVQSWRAPLSPLFPANSLLPSMLWCWTVARNGVPMRPGGSVGDLRLPQGWPPLSRRHAYGAGAS